MSDLGSLLDRLRAAEAAATRLEQGLAQEPGDRALRLDLLSARRQTDKLQKAFQEAAVDQGVDVCSYRIVPELAAGYAIDAVTRSLRAFQDVFTIMYAALVAGPRKTANVGKDLAARSTLAFGYTFAGSLGVVLTLDGGKTLFDDQFDTTVRALSQAIDITSQDNVRDAAQKLGPAAIKKLFDWASGNYESAYSIDLRWRTSHGLELGRYIARQDFVKVMDAIGMTSDVNREVTVIRGLLAGGDILTKRFHFVDNEDKDYRGYLSNEFQAQRLELGMTYRARLLVETTFRYATEEEDRRYTLLALEDDAAS